MRTQRTKMPLAAAASFCGVLVVATPVVAAPDFVLMPPPPRARTSQAPAPKPVQRGEPVDPHNLVLYAKVLRALDLAIAYEEAKLAGEEMSSFDAADELPFGSRIDVTIGEGAEAGGLRIATNPTEAWASETPGVSRITVSPDGTIVAAIGSRSDLTVVEIRRGDDGMIRVSVDGMPELTVDADGRVRLGDPVSLGRIDDLGAPGASDENGKLSWDVDWSPASTRNQARADGDGMVGALGGKFDPNAGTIGADGQSVSVSPSSAATTAPGAASGPARVERHREQPRSGSSTLPSRNSSAEDQFTQFESLLAARGASLSTEPNQRTVIGLRGVTPDGRTCDEETRKVRAYSDTFVVLWRDAEGGAHVERFLGSTTPGQTRTRFAGTPDVNRDGTKDIAHLAPGTYRYRARRFKGQSAYGCPDALPVYRDTTHDGRIGENERRASIYRGDTARGILFHRGATNIPRSVGCQTLSPQEFDRFERALGGDRSWTYTLVQL